MDKRKTQEYVVSRPSSRISRLVQPRKYSCTPHALRRDRSLSTENIGSHSRGASKRSHSATRTTTHFRSETPLRPIARSLSNLFTPASTTKNKKPLAEHTSRILEVLRKHHFGPAFLPGGLQSMTAKQFVEIIRFFAQTILGNKIVIQDNNIDDVKRFVDLIEYPHQMNKSWFKTPTLSVAFERNVEFLDWLCDFVSLGDNENTNEIGDLECFGDQQFSNRFMADLTNGYVIFNSGAGSDSQKWVDKWTDELIFCKTQTDDIVRSIDRIQKEYQDMQTKETSFVHEDFLQIQLKKSSELGERVAEVEAVVGEKMVDLQERSNDMNLLSAKHEELTTTVNKMKATVKEQNVSAEDRNRMVLELTEKKGILAEKRAFLASIKSIADENEVKIARMKVEKTSKIFAFNVLMQKLFQMGIAFENLTLSQVSINETDNKEEIKTKLELFHRIKEMINKRRNCIHSSLNETQTICTSTSNELSKIEHEIAGLEKHLHSLEVQKQKIDNEILDAEYNAQRNHQQLQTEIDRLREAYNKLNFQIENSEKLAESLREENKKIFNGIERKADQLLNAKRRDQARQEAALLELEQVADELEEVVNNLK